MTCPPSRSHDLGTPADTQADTMPIREGIHGCFGGAGGTRTHDLTDYESA